MKNQEPQDHFKATVGFRIHLAIYITVVALHAFVNMTTTSEVIWWRMPLLFWGIAVIIHASKAHTPEIEPGIDEIVGK